MESASLEDSFEAGHDDDEVTASPLEQQHTLRFCGSTLLRALTAAARRAEAGHLRLLFEELSVAHAVRHTMLVEHMDESELAPSASTLAILGWLAARGCLPDGDDAMISRCRELAHDLHVRCEQLLQDSPSSGFATLLRGYAEATAELRDRLAAHERRA